MGDGFEERAACWANGVLLFRTTSALKENLRHLRREMSSPHFSSESNRSDAVVQASAAYHRNLTDLDTRLKGAVKCGATDAPPFELGEFRRSDLDIQQPEPLSFKRAENALDTLEWALGVAAEAEEPRLKTR